VDTGRFAIASASPELFFERAGPQLTMRPMKGTAPRGRWSKEDAERAEWLGRSEKNRAENVMIVDMVRNDLGRVAEIGSVRVRKLWQTERYPTVWQLTSTVQAASDAPLTEVLRATFPCASVTGAPKRRTMQIIAELEPEPRGVYTGCIGFIAPQRRAQFNVAIRTMVLDRHTQCAEYGVGGGIVWDSKPDDEYREAHHKARVLTERVPEFSLLESLRWEPARGYWLLDYHLRRLRASADYFDYAFDAARVRAGLEHGTRELPAVPHKVRLLLRRDGGVIVTSAPLQIQREPVRLVMARTPVNSNDRFLFHKTTARAQYDVAWSERGRSFDALGSDADDVLLWNERGELTETCNANLVVRLGDDLFTPPVECGLLGGTYRAYLLEQGEIRERVIHKDELEHARALFRINSVRGWQSAELLGPQQTEGAARRVWSME
jgi:para-aminobenzoate synthetase/4-amino-4-deoxychorismate lyase